MNEAGFNNVQVLQEELRLRGFKMKQEDVKEVYLAFCDMIRDFARNGFELNFPNIGKFVIVEHKPRQLTSNLTGEVTELPSRKKLKFKASKKLTDMINRR